MTTRSDLNRWCCPSCKKHLGGHALLTPEERHTAAHALHTMADQFDADAKTARAAAQARTAEAFDKQARESRELADRIEL